MKLISRLRESRFCAFCRSSRLIYSRKHVSLTNVAACLLLAACLSYLLWGYADPRALVLFSIALVVAEVFVYARWRSSIACKKCGFDPIVYKRSPSQASLAVREFYELESKKSTFYLSNSPLVDVRRKLMAAERRKNKYQSRDFSPPGLVPKNPEL